MIEAFGKYLLLEKVASGGMAEVYLAKSSGANGINKFLGIKRILPQYSDHPEFIEMFKEEAKIAVNLNHGNVVSIYDFGIEKKQFYLVMDFVEGQNLRQILNHMKKENREFSIDQIVYVIKEVAAGLDHAHRCLDGTTGRPLNITHRDMSPQNVMVSFEGEVKVVDFGIAKAENQIEHTRAGTIKGKFGYMSPEQADGQPVDLRTDIFSLGIVLWELLASDRLFVAQSEAATLRRVRECQIPSLRKINPNIPPELERICTKALAKDRSLRYQTAAAFHKDLNRFLNLQYPEFSTQEFSKFMKSLYNKMYVENRKKFAEFAKLSMEEEKTAITQTATATLTATATDIESSDDSNAAHETATKPTTGHVAVNPTPFNQVPQPPNRNVTINPPEPTQFASSNNSEGSEDKLKNVDSVTSSKVDMSALRVTENTKTSPKLQAALKEATRSNTATGYGNNTRTGPYPSGTQSRISERYSIPRRKISPMMLAAVFLGVAALAYIFILSPRSGGIMALFGRPREVASENILPSEKPPENKAKDPLPPPVQNSANGANNANSPTQGQTQPQTAGQNLTDTPANLNPGDQVPLAIHSQPTGAIVYINGTNRGFTPFRGWVELGKSFRVTLVKDEFLPYDRGEIKSNSAEGVTIRATLQPEPPTGYIGVEVINGGGEPVISVNGVRLAEKPPIQRYPVPAGVPVKIRVYNPITQLYAEETVIVGVGQKRPVRLILGRSGQN